MNGDRTAPRCGTDLAETQLELGPAQALSTIEYQRHRPEQTLLYQVIREQLENFIVDSASAPHPSLDLSNANCVPTSNAACSPTAFFACTATPVGTIACSLSPAKGGPFAYPAVEDAWRTLPLIW